jgi:hypothetical protein
VVAGAGLALVGLAAILWAAALYRGAVYPGAHQISDNLSYKFGRSLYIRRDTMYRTDDSFAKIYQWYSTTFETGPEKRGMGSCNDLERSRTWLIFQQDVSITLCDTLEGRMMFVMRSVSLRRARPPVAPSGP